MLRKLLGDAWAGAVEPHLDMKYFEWLGTELASQYQNYTVYPPQKDIFNAFQCTPYDKVKVLVLGQDCYTKEGQACGVSFGINDETCFFPPASLRNIEKEVEEDIYDGFHIGFDYSMRSWCDQGCFMYNTALTVVKDKVGSHLKTWAPFTEAVMKALNDKDFCIYLLLGKVAQDYEKYLSHKQGQYIIKAPHPAAESYSGGSAGFFGSKVFSQINTILANNNYEIIKW